MKKVFIAFLLAILPISALQVSAFSDIQNSEFKPYIEKMIEERLVSGYDDGLFRPSNPVSFAESLKIATNTAVGPMEIPPEVNWADAYEKVYNNVFFQAEKKFSQNQKISRDFAMYIILRNLDINLENAKIPNQFPDVKDASIFANYINFAKMNGIINGYSDGKFGPNNRVTRGEFAKMTWRAIREDREKILEAYKNITTTNINKTEEKKEEEKTETSKQYATIVSVTDGDTVKIQTPEGKTETIRLVGIDTPESFDTRFGHVECYGKEASNFLSQYLSKGARVEVTYYGNDKYKRDLAELHYNGKSVSEVLMEGGYAWVYRNGIKPANYEKLLKIEDSLRGSEVGLWSKHTCNGKRIAIKEEKKEKPTTSTITNSRPSTSRVCYTGPRGGRYYINDKGKKVYDCD